MEVVRSLHECGANLHAATTTGATPAYSASEDGPVGVVRALHELGANLDAAETDGWTPAHIASQEGHVEVVRALPEGGGAASSGGSNTRKTPPHPREAPFTAWR